MKAYSSSRSGNPPHQGIAQIIASLEKVLDVQAADHDAKGDLQFPVKSRQEVLDFVDRDLRVDELNIRHKADLHAQAVRGKNLLSGQCDPHLACVDFYDLSRPARDPVNAGRHDPNELAAAVAQPTLVLQDGYPAR